MRASDAQLAQLLERYGLAPPAIGGSDSLAASRGGHIGLLRLLRDDAGAKLEFTLGRTRVTAEPPHSFEEAKQIVDQVRSEAALPHDSSFEHMVAGLLLKATTLFEECTASCFELRSLHLHPTSYHIGGATLIHPKPIRVKAPLDGKSREVRSVFSVRPGASMRPPR